MPAGSPDYPKVAMWSVLLLGLGAFFWKVIRPAMAASSPDPNAPGGANDPANNPTAAGLLAQAGDLVAVPNAAILGTGQPDPVQMRITAAAPGSAFVHARVEDARVPGTPIATNIARGNILRIVSHQPATPTPTPGGGPPAGVRPIPLGDPLELLSGRTYLATIALSGAEKMFATEGAIQAQLSQLGFQDVQVSRQPIGSDYPQDGPAGDFYARGTWGGADQNGSRPSRIAAAWRIG